MKIGIPQELKDHETRIALTPEAVLQLAKKGHYVFVQHKAGIQSGYSDAQYREAGAKILGSIQEIYALSDFIVKVKEPLPEEYAYLRPKLILFCYLHLAANRKLISELRKKRVSAFAFETLVNSKGETPLLKPMSEIAGRLSIYLGSDYLRSDLGGKGVLISPTSFVAPAHIVIIGGGNVGCSAAELALKLGAKVSIFDLHPNKLKTWKKQYPALEIFRPTPQLLSKKISEADLLIGAVYTPGAKATRVIKKSMIQSMEKGSVFIDVAIDQGGSAETSRLSSISLPTYTRYGVIHAAIPNLPALVGRTAARALSKNILPYVKRIAALPSKNWDQDSELKSSLNLHQGNILHPESKRVFYQKMRVKK